MLVAEARPGDPGVAPPAAPSFDALAGATRAAGGPGGRSRTESASRAESAQRGTASASIRTRARRDRRRLDGARRVARGRLGGDRLLGRIRLGEPAVGEIVLARMTARIDRLPEEGANVGYPGAVLEAGEVQATARTVGLEVTTVEIRRAEDIATVFEAFKGRVEALYVCADPLLGTHRIRINTLALGARLTTMHGNREHVEAGGLMSYGANFPDLYRRAAHFVDKILRGAKPADLPVEQPTKFDLVINLKTAKALDLEMPPTLLARADEVIE